MKLINADYLYNWIKAAANPYGKPTLDYDTALKVMDMIDRMSDRNAVGWIPADNPPKTDDTNMSDYIMLSFENFSIPMVGRYEMDDEGNGAYYVGDDEKSCISYEMIVNAWMPLPEPYR